MIQRAERMGLINQNTHLIEATSGNTGIGLALAAIRSGYKLTLVIPDRVSANKIAHAKALGAEIVITRSDVQRGHPEHFQDYAERLARELPEAFHLDQFRNPGNAEAHEFGTGPEIFRQMEGSVDAIVCGVGSGGTITGVGHCMKKISPHTEMLLADPIGSIVGPTILGEKNPEYQRYMIEGIGSDFIPPLLDREVINQVYQILDQDGLLACRDLMRFEGIHAGTSSGLLLAAALKYCRAQRVPKRVVTFVCDTGDKYFLKVYGVAN